MDNMKIIIDTNGFMSNIQFGLDFFKELERLGFKDFIAPSSVVREMDALKRFSKGKDKMAANVGLSLAQKCRQIITEGPADDAIIELALEEGAAVYTNDAELKKRLSSKDITIVHLRSKDHLEIM
jgi:rRNA-processing protein FCF1